MVTIFPNAADQEREKKKKKKKTFSREPYFAKGKGVLSWGISTLQNDLTSNNPHSEGAQQSLSSTLSHSDGIQQNEKQGEEIHFPVMRRSDKINIPLMRVTKKL
jgi:hypothetical protein